MNILPHKSWHVRTKANIARVRKDQAKAAEEEAEKQRRINLAECEARIDSLRKKKSSGSEGTITSALPDHDHDHNHDQETASPQRSNAFPADQHIDLFADYKEKITTAKPMDEEKRLEQEKYEKQIGYLTYLGQDTHEANRTRNWYDVAPKRKDDAFDEAGRLVEVGLKAKHRYDPMRIFAPYAERDDRPRVKSSNEVAKVSVAAEPQAPEPSKPASSTLVKYSPIMPGLKRKTDGSSDNESRKKKRKLKDKDKLKKDKKDKKKNKKHKKDKQKESEILLKKALEKQKADGIALLREKRLRREAEERLRTYELLQAKTPSGAPAAIPAPTLKEAEPIPFVKQKYNSQFNPYLAKQNFN